MHFLTLLTTLSKPPKSIMLRHNNNNYQPSQDKSKAYGVSTVYEITILTISTQVQRGGQNLWSEYSMQVHNINHLKTSPNLMVSEKFLLTT